MDLRSLPKAHLHLHLDGAVRPATLVELCDAAGTAAPAIPADGSYASFADFLAAIGACHAVLRSAANVARVVGEVVEDAAADGAVWVELSVWPGLFGGALGPDREALAAVADAGRRAGRDHGVGFGVMVAANREHGPAAALELARVAGTLAGDGVVSFGLDGDEAAFPPAPFADAFALARSAGLLATPHAGELLGPESVADALDRLGAHRVLHGVRAAEDPALVARLAEGPATLDVCPSSNVKLGVATIDTHPLPGLLAAGVRCSVNADDPGLFGTSLLGEYELCRRSFGLDAARLAAMAATSIASSGAPERDKQAWAAGVAAWTARATASRA